jgi:hypothetical protein
VGEHKRSAMRVRDSLIDRELPAYVRKV